MKISILTLFPDMFTGPFSNSIVKHARNKGLVDLEILNIRDSATDKHQTVDDTPYGGGIGMVMRVDVVHAAINKARGNKVLNGKQLVVLLTASGKPFSQHTAESYTGLDHLILVCGHYEGIDDRIKHFVDQELSIGEFVVTGGELPAMLVADAVIRLLPGVLKPGATEQESYTLADKGELLLEYPQYTKPVNYLDYKVPDVLLSGNHAEIAKWRLQEAINKTKSIRPEE